MMDSRVKRENDKEMTGNDYLLFTTTSRKTVKLARLWLYNAVFALGVAGLFALPPVILRKTLAGVADAQRIFDTALIIHVNMSVLVWLISICCMVFSMRSAEKIYFFSRGSAFLAMFGTILMAVSPFIAHSVPYTNNYIPALGNIWFLLGLACFAAGVILQSAVCLLSFRFSWKFDDNFARSFAAYSTAIIILIAFLCFTLSGHELKNATLAPKDYYENLFWAGGHILQFAYIQMMIFAWAWVGRVESKPWQPIFIYSFALAMVIAAPFVYLEYPALSGEHADFFTRQMQYGLGIAPLMAGMALLFSRRKAGVMAPEKNAIIFSLILFIAGGMIGFMIQGSNAIIPAHYHGSIVAVTLSFMALVYDVLPRLGFKKATGKIAAWQPIIYGTGQLMHISGLAIMGGYGALRKTANSSAAIDTTIGKTLFFSGGGLAIIGGFLFVFITVKAMLEKDV